jgi:hypothetical protein
VLRHIKARSSGNPGMGNNMDLPGGGSNNTGKDLLKLSPEDRAAASMFYIGYQASRVRTSTINVGMIPSIEGQAIAYCEENPERTVAQAFALAYSLTRR